jgi:hypothetical protein
MQVVEHGCPTTRQLVPPLGNWPPAMQGLCMVYVGMPTMWVHLHGLRAWPTPPLVC